jgi:hypothetical protein
MDFYREPTTDDGIQHWGCVNGLWVYVISYDKRVREYHASAGRFNGVETQTEPLGFCGRWSQAKAACEAHSRKHRQ